MSSSAIFNPAFYPIGLNLTNKTVLVIGGGAVATRKLQRLATTGCRIQVVSPHFSDGIRQLADSAEPSGSICLIQQAYSPKLFQEIQPDLVFACTNDKAVNHQVAADAKHLRIWMNCATDGVIESDFIVPGLIAYDDLQIALFSGGASPMLIRYLREMLENLIGPWMIPYLEALRQLRQEIQHRVPDEAQRRSLHEAVLADASILQAIRENTASPEKIVSQLCQTLFSTTP